MQSEIVFQAKKISTGETRRFTLSDLYGYEGEVCGVIIGTRDESGTLCGSDDWILSYNSGVSMDGMNPDLEISCVCAGS